MWTIQTGDEEGDEDRREGFLEDIMSTMKSSEIIQQKLYQNKPGKCGGVRWRVTEHPRQEAIDEARKRNY